MIALYTACNHLKHTPQNNKVSDYVTDSLLVGQLFWVLRS
jgi:hypothetical protein